jgi:hypothetical protein
VHTNNPDNPVNPVKKERRDASITRSFQATRQIRPLLFATPCATNRIFIGKTAKVGVLGQVLAKKAPMPAAPIHATGVRLGGRLAIPVPRLGTGEDGKAWSVIHYNEFMAMFWLAFNDADV